ncbi:hypothetical protein [Streptomyces scabiei]|uniref:hypothetical protein n=1 Tax=Streptomyces scabiei TaxID=1930 RepID=UPI001F2A6FCC|nr:hypothetical protein [Streptomyces scabiei]
MDSVRGWEVFTRFSREVFDSAHPEDGAEFDPMLADFRRDPHGFLRSRRLRPKVGSGVVLQSAIPYVLPLVSLLVGVVAERAANGVLDAISDATRRKLTRLLEQRRAPTAAPVTPQDGETDAAAAAVVTDMAPASGLDPDEERALRTLLTAWAAGMRMDEAKARELADTILDVLRQRGDQAL